MRLLSLVLEVSLGLWVQQACLGHRDYKACQAYQEQQEKLASQVLLVHEGSPGVDGAAVGKESLGLQGGKGESGVRGKAGPQGKKGEIGARGPVRMKGQRGNEGEKGVKGEIGGRGLKGSQGIQGLAGPIGPPGLLGGFGGKGQKGDKGLKGIAGTSRPAEVLQLERLVTSLSNQLEDTTAQMKTVIQIMARYGSCYELFREKFGRETRNGNYFITSSHSTTPRLVNCTMRSSNSGGWREVNDSKVVRVTALGVRQQVTFTISDYGYNPSVYKFRQVIANIEFDGDLDGSSAGESVRTFFGSTQIGGKLTTSSCSKQFVQLPSWPVSRYVDATTFTMGVTAAHDVDDRRCNAGGHKYGDIRFTLIKFREGN